MSAQKRHDILGILCGLFLVAVLIVNIVLSNMVSTAGAKAGEVPAEAATLTGTAPGRNGPIDVEVVASPEKIYQIKILNHSETDGIGSVAVDQLPAAIYDSQSLMVDSIAGATISSDAIKEPVRNALAAGGISTATWWSSAPAARA